MSNEQALSPDYANAKVIYGPLHRDTLVQLLAERDAALAARPSPARDKVLELDIPALASAIHDARFDKGRETSSWVPFESEGESGKIYCTRIANAVQMHLLAALKAQPPSTVGEDATAGEFVMVPRKLTSEMEDAHYRAHAEARNVFADAATVWSAMIAAAPKPTQPSIGMDEREKIARKDAAVRLIIEHVVDGDPETPEDLADAILALSATPASVGEDR